MIKSLHGRFFILGLGRSGVALARRLQGLLLPFLAWDTNQQVRETFAQDFGNQFLQNIDDAVWQNIDTLVVSPGIDIVKGPNHLAVQKAKEAGVRICCDVALFCEGSPSALGITGTNGKSTTTALTTHILKEAGHQAVAGGNIGIPVFDLPSAEVYVLEVSSYQLDLMKKEPMPVQASTKVAQEENIAWPAFSHGALLNITPDHLAYHGSLEAYVGAKENILKLLAPEGKCIIGLDTPLSKKIYEEYKDRAALIPIATSSSLHKGVFWDQGVLYDTYFSGNTRIDFRELGHLQGQHNAQNILAAYALCRLMGVAPDEIQKNILSFKGLAHRQELIGAWKGVKFINDSKATNVASMLTALPVFEEIWLFLGGQMKEGDSLAPILKYKNKIKRIYAFGASREKVEKFFQTTLPLVVCPTLQEAIASLLQDLQETTTRPQTVLFSPASASFDAFRNYEERGDFFKRGIQANICLEE